jgi:hypothetical protein
LGKNRPPLLSLPVLGLPSLLGALLVSLRVSLLEAPALPSMVRPRRQVS